MYTHHDVKLAVLVQRLVHAIIIVHLFGVAVLTGWRFDIVALNRLVPDVVAMSSVSARAFVLAAAPLFLQLPQPSELPHQPSSRILTGEGFGPARDYCSMHRPRGKAWAERTSRKDATVYFSFPTDSEL